MVIKPKPGAYPIESLHNELADEPFVKEARIEGETIRLYVVDGTRVLPLIFDRLKAHDVGVESLYLSEPSLDDVFLHHTGRSLRDTGNPGNEGVAT